MSRTEREIARLRDERDEYRSRYQSLRAEMNAAAKANPHCRGCAALRADLDAARALVDELAK